jgi:N-acetylneuraminic acid mutarotase
MIDGQVAGKSVCCAFPARLVIIGDHMRRLLVPILVFMTLVVLAAGVWADDRPAGQTDDALIVAKPPENWIGEEIKVTDLEPVPRGPDAGPAADVCGEATPLNLSFANSADGSGTVTNLFSQEPTDPILACMFGTPTSPRGYRTAWYQLTAGDTSVVTITTEGTDYDTVVGVFAGTCDALQALACSDDFRGFQSSVTFSVVRGRTYYIVVADYRPGTPVAATLQLSAIMRAGGARWSQISNMPFGGVSRHSIVSEGPEMYIIGGQTNLSSTPVISNRMLRYNVISNQWVELANVPGSSVSNTTAVRLGRKIYVPGGFNGNTSEYVNVHLSYDIATDFWDQITPIPTGLLPSGRMFAWSAGAAGPGDLSYFLTGGLTSFPPLDPDAAVLNNTYVYTPATNQWAAFAPMTTPRYAHTSAWIFTANRGLCVAGGLATGTNDEGEPATVLLTDGECNNVTPGGWVKTGPLNFPRYNAGSAVGPDGNWYIFGGLDAVGGIPETEVYDPITNSWRPLGGEFSLGGTPDNPPRVWPRGAFWGDTLYVFGGNTPNEQRVISAVDRMTIGAGFVPLAHTVLLPFSGSVGSDNVLANGTPLTLNVPVSGNFVESTQFYNPYYFDWLALGRATLRLTDIPSNSNFNVSIYDRFKVLRSQGNTAIFGGEKVASATLEPGRYYVLVERIFPKDLPRPGDIYQLTLSSP